MSANLFICGRIVWRAELKETESGKPMRSVLIASDGENMPSVHALIFGGDAGHAEKGDNIAAEGELEASIMERESKPTVSLSIMARWSKLTGHAGARQRRSEAQQTPNKEREQPADLYGGRGEDFGDHIPFWPPGEERMPGTDCIVCGEICTGVRPMDYLLIDPDDHAGKRVHTTCHLESG